MASQASTPGGLRQRQSASKKKDGGASHNASDIDVELDKLAKTKLKAGKSDNELEYKIAGVVITALAFLTRFWGIQHPNEVVFDEVHFGKVRSWLDPRPELCVAGSKVRKLIVDFLIVRFPLPAKDILLRCASALRKASLCPDRLAGWIRWPFPL